MLLGDAFDPSFTTKLDGIGISTLSVIAKNNKDAASAEQTV